MKKERGFHHIAQHIAKSRGISIQRANAILASATRHASPAAHKANPRLNKVRG